MKLIHLSDLHIGKRVNEFSMLEDQRYILDQITGTIIGIAACEKQRYCCDYIAAEDTVLMEYPYKQAADLEKLFAEQPKYATVFPMAAVKQANTVLNYYGKRTELAKKLYSMGVGMYRDYKYLCSKYDLTEKQLMSMEHLVPLEQSYILEEWKQGYFQALAGKDMQSVNAFLGTDFAVGIGTMLYAGKVINEVLAKMEGVRDYLHYWQDILLPAGRAQEPFLRRDGKVAPRRGCPVVQFVRGVGEKPWGTGGFTVIQQRVVR